MADALTGADVARLVARLTVAYGSRFMAQWVGVSTLELQRIWWQGLHGLDRGAAAWALAHLPDDPPTVAQFVALAQQRPETADPGPISLDPWVECPPAAMARLQATAAAMRLPGTNGDRLAWARRLRAREARGEFLSRLQRQAWRVALGVSAGDVA